MRSAVDLAACITAETGVGCQTVRAQLDTALAIPAVFAGNRVGITNFAVVFRPDMGYIRDVRSACAHHCPFSGPGLNRPTASCHQPCAALLVYLAGVHASGVRTSAW